jgi:hypothetical protein
VRDYVNKQGEQEMRSESEDERGEAGRGGGGRENELARDDEPDETGRSLCFMYMVGPGSCTSRSPDPSHSRSS